jgi:hypothetical protein
MRKLAAICCMFNPQASPWRLANHREFAAHMEDQGIELWTVEGVPAGQPFALDGDRVLQIETHAILWHKERLLNLLLRQLPADITDVAWIDADVLFEREDLQAATLAALDEYPVVQLWSEAELLGADDRPAKWHDGRQWVTSMAAANVGRQTTRKDAGAKPKRDANPARSHPGFAWAARRSVLDATGGLYDRHPVGSGDSLMAIGWYVDFGCGWLRDYTPRARSKFFAWAKLAAQQTRGRVGLVDGRISHLYHGTLADRQYVLRNRVLRQHEFDPERDLAEHPNGTLIWSETCPAEIRDWVEDYLLRQRKEK